MKNYTVTIQIPMFGMSDKPTKEEVLSILKKELDEYKNLYIIEDAVKITWDETPLWKTTGIPKP